jgi:hypothetical protein
MKQISDALSQHLSQDCTTLCRILKITRTDGVVIYLTDHDHDIVYDDSGDLE